MQPDRPPILLTSSVIAYDLGVALKDTELRIRYALESIEKWLEISPKSQLVLCDGSNFDFSALVKNKFPHAQIECLFFENNQLFVSQYGRGYGEGEIIKYAIYHSQVINIAGCFAKCSSKLWVDNYEKILIHWTGLAAFKGVFKNEFSLIGKTHFDYIDTRFYICQVKFYNDYLLDAHQEISNNLNLSLEEVFINTLHFNNLKNYLMPIHPLILGVGGGIGKNYKIKFFRNYKENLKIVLLISKSKFKNYFSN